MKIKLMLICVLAVTGLTYGASAPVVQARGPFSDVSRLLTELQSTVEKSRSTIMVIDIASLSVTYAEGKILEDARRLALAYADRVQDGINALRQKQTLPAYFQLSDTLDHMDSNLDSLSALLSNTITATPSDRALMWSENLFDARKSLSSPAQKWYDETLKTMRAADLLLATCQSR